MIRINPNLNSSSLRDELAHFWALSGQKILSIENGFDFSQGSPVFTQGGMYCTRGWTDWTLGFHYGSALLHYDATSQDVFLDLARNGLRHRMESHLTHTGVHDHGFNTVSTFGNLRRLILEGKIPRDEWELRYLELAVKCSAAVQASRWTETKDGGFIYSFNGPHSLFADTIRSLRVLALGHILGHQLMGENDRKISLLERLVLHARATARYTVYYGDGRDVYDVKGRVAHESVFNTVDGEYRCPSTQQGYSSRTTWTRGLAWIILGYAEMLEFLEDLPDTDLENFGGKTEIRDMMLKAANASCEFYIDQTPANGIPYWDTGAPGLSMIPNYLEQPADPYNDHEPVDSSAAAIAAQGLLRLGRYLKRRGRKDAGTRYWQAGLTIAASLFSPPYLSEEESHQGLILHSVYHRPNGWDSIPQGRLVPSGESSMWGDYHSRELALLIDRNSRNDTYFTFYCSEEQSR